MKRKLRFGIPFGIVAGTLAIASIAWACTPQNGWTRLTTPACPAVSCTAASGTDIIAHATDVVKFSDPADPSKDLYTLVLSIEPWCHPSSGNVSLTSNTNTPDAVTKHMPATGTDWSLDGKPDAKGTIPLRHRKGDYDVCFNNGVGGTGTNSNSTYPLIITVT